MVKRLDRIKGWNGQVLDTAAYSGKVLLVNDGLKHAFLIGLP